MISDKSPVSLSLLLALQGVTITALLGVFGFMWSMRGEQEARYVSKEYVQARFDEVLRRLDRLENLTPR